MCPPGDPNVDLLRTHWFLANGRMGVCGFEVMHCSTTNRPARWADVPGPCDRVAAITVLDKGGDRMSELL
ncbi:hypothetical protein M8J75_005246 [Diaphorina citri]|nr:hypothetical protein M8J75_005246 [Diaphorina citri]